jgi:CheY-like chemotaxis protein
MKASGLCVLLVEDDPNDAFFLRHAFQTSGVINPLKVVVDGQQAIDYLAGNGPYSDRTEHPLPCLILLDLKLPLMPGVDVLKWIRNRKELIGLPVIVLTSSQDDRDIHQCYELGASSFLVKTLTLDERLRLVRAIKEYWLEFNEIPLEREAAPVRKRGK